MAFYKDAGGKLFEVESMVVDGATTLRVEQKDTYAYPVDGWYWFDTRDEAIAALGLPIWGT